ncbi:hypothetical protein MRB53_039086 [Persea americana]|nr:hypothetical protein MRB53_039086 [Persea americana]
MRLELNLLLNNLESLNIITYAQERYRISISRDTFGRLQDHKKAAEVILYCLFKLLSPTHYRDRLSQHFPCINGLKAKEFRNATYKWLNELKKERHLGDVIVRRSILDDCAGARYEDLLLQLSSHVLRLTCYDLRPSSYIGQRILGNHATMVELQMIDLAQRYKLQVVALQRETAKAMYCELGKDLRNYMCTSEMTNKISSPSSIKMELERIALIGSPRLIDLIRPEPPASIPCLPWVGSVCKEGEEKVRDQLKQRIESADQFLIRLRTEVRKEKIVQPKLSRTKTLDVQAVQKVVYRTSLASEILSEMSARLQSASEYGHTAESTPFLKAASSVVQTPTTPKVEIAAGRSIMKLPRSVLVQKTRHLFPSPIKSFKTPDLPPQTVQGTVARLVDLLVDTTSYSTETADDLNSPSKTSRQQFEPTFSLWKHSG